MNNPSDYSFSAEEKHTVAKTGLWATVLGAALCAQGLANLPDVVEAPTRTLLSIALALFIGGAFVSAGATLRSVGTTEEDNILLLMRGYRQLTRAFALRIAVTALAMVFVALALLLFLAA